jgi:DNA polymerase-3 subunit chi
VPPRVDFYVTEESGEVARLRLACRVVEKAYLARQLVTVYFDDSDSLARFDELLWTFGDGSFVPHDTITASGADCTAAVTLANGVLPAAHSEVLLSLSQVTPPDFKRFARVVEVLDGRPEVRSAARNRFKLYREHGASPATHAVG